MVLDIVVDRWKDAEGFVVQQENELGGYISQARWRARDETIKKISKPTSSTSPTFLYQNISWPLSTPQHLRCDRITHD